MKFVPVGAEPKVMNPFADTYICVYTVPLKLNEGIVCALETWLSNEPLKPPQSCVPPLISLYEPDEALKE